MLGALRRLQRHSGAFKRRLQVPDIACKRPTLRDAASSRYRLPFSPGCNRLSARKRRSARHVSAAGPGRPGRSAP
eukprot:3934321-Alexandrium_andersonii.AAC.1